MPHHRRKNATLKTQQHLFIIVSVNYPNRVQRLIDGRPHPYKKINGFSITRNSGYFDPL